DENLRLMLETGVVGVVRTESPKELLQIAKAIRAGGVRCIEIAMTTPGALRVIEEVASQLDDVLVGAGTVLDPETARMAILAGAEFIVSPTLNFKVIELAKRYGKVVAPGTFSPTEILSAWEAGADIVKVFPATRLGPQYFKDIKAPLPQVRLMPTGGVDASNAAEFIRAGADVICVGSALIDKKAIAEGKFEVLTENARKLIAAVKEGRGGR
ncbi:MAG: bifunctional 4-hydroxy-2-oxoglutarate aldolase/2-dehydro-3-deoxy-phosphogluconate aldolase, partial [Candidatus Bipolaricaulia bacterium]